jgi:SAM-dependent methyltransferase
MNCRHCKTALTLPLVDLGSAPPSNAYLTAETLHGPERWYPLRVLVCERCWLVQTEDFAAADELFDAQYAYFSSTSTSWLAHAKLYAESMATRYGLHSGSHVVEIASNDGYLLQYFRAAGIPCTGIEPTASTAAAAQGKGIRVIEEFFGEGVARRLAAEGRSADLMAANNVLAHVPDINDFLRGFAALLKPQGVATFEFPHLLNLLRLGQFDTIYHEHYSYLSMIALTRIFAANGLDAFRVERIPTHGGSLRVFTQRSDSGSHPADGSVEATLEEERQFGMDRREGYSGFQERAERIRDDFTEFLIRVKREGKSVVGYGAAAKGNTLMNFAGTRPDLVRCVVDRNPAKQGKFMPGSRIPIVSLEALETSFPDYIVVFPWNIIDEVQHECAGLLGRGSRTVRAIPQLVVSG